MNKEEIINYFNLNRSQKDNIEAFLSNIVKYSKHTNLIGRSTIEHIWTRHVLDCLQLSKHIERKKTKILDLGTGAGLPGVLLSIIGYKNILMIDSARKKAEFVNLVIKELSLPAKIINKRLKEEVLSKEQIRRYEYAKASIQNKKKRAQKKDKIFFERGGMTTMKLRVQGTSSK